MAAVRSAARDPPERSPPWTAIRASRPPPARPLEHRPRPSVAVGGAGASACCSPPARSSSPRSPASRPRPARCRPAVTTARRRRATSPTRRRPRPPTPHPDVWNARVDRARPERPGLVQPHDQRQLGRQRLLHPDRPGHVERSRDQARRQPRPPGRVPAARLQRRAAHVRVRLERPLLPQHADGRDPADRPHGARPRRAADGEDAGRPAERWRTASPARSTPTATPASRSSTRR